MDAASAPENDCGTRRTEQPPAPLAANRAWVYARRAELELALGRPGPALSLAMRARTLAPANPAAAKIVDTVRRRVDPELPRVDADGLVRTIEGVDGWLTGREATLLARCVAATPANGGAHVVEIGSYHGRSTLAIALAIQLSGQPLRLTAIDPHTGYAFGDGRDTYRSLVDTLRAHRVDRLVEVVRARSVDVSVDRAVAMAFIDGLHDEASVRGDYSHLAPHVQCGGLVVFHDYVEPFPGVVAAVNDLLVDGGHELVGYADSLVALRVVKPLRNPRRLERSA